MDVYSLIVSVIIILAVYLILTMLSGKTQRTGFDAKSLVLAIVIVVVLYFVYTWLFSDGQRTYLSGIRDAGVEYTIQGSRVPSGNNADYTYSIWLYIANWNTRIGESKVIFERGSGQGAKPVISMALTPLLNNLEVTLATYSGGEPSASNSDSISNTGTGDEYKCTLLNVPLQAWTNIIITLNNRALDMYMNGKLVRTCVLPAVPRMAVGTSIRLCPNSLGGGGAGFQGNISNFQYFSKAINPREAYAIYREGPGTDDWLSNLFNRYRLKIAFMKDNREVNSLQI